MDGTQLQLFDLELFDDLKRYLDDKKEGLKTSLFLVISQSAFKGDPVLTFPFTKSLSLDQTVKEFEKEIDKLPPAELKMIRYDVIGEKISDSLISLVEILEGMSRELFEQLKYSQIDKWNSDFCENVSIAKELIHESCLELISFVKELNKALRKFYLKILKLRPSFIEKLRVYIHQPVDPSILKSLNQCDKLLNHKFKEFAQNQKFINQHLTTIEGLTYRFQGYQAFSEFDSNKKNQFVRIWRLLQLFKIAQNDNKKSLPYIESTIKTISPSGKTILLFKEYLARIRQLGYDLARSFRGKREVSAQAVLCSLRAEAQTLLNTSKEYRHFLINTDHHPTRYGLKIFDKLFGVEARKSKELNHLCQEVDRIDHKLSDLFDAQEGEDSRTVQEVIFQFMEIDRLITEMGQPLTSRALLSKKGDELVHKLIEVNEVTAPLAETSILVQDALIRALRIDSKFNTLLEKGDFHEIVDTHRGLFGQSLALSHLKRIKQYKRILEHLRGWSSKHELSRHSHETEADAHDIQESLQEFFHSLPQKIPEGSINSFRDQILDLKKQLLEERLLFAQFFYFIREHEHESRILRAELQFIDPYLEAIENKLRNFNSVIVK